MSRMMRTALATSQVVTEFRAKSKRSIFLRNGSLFVIRPVRDEKGLTREPPTCKDDSPHGRRTWYNSFQRHAMDNGFYVHPLYCFRKDKGGPRGFSAGNDADDDLPLRLEVPLVSMSQPLFKALSKKDMFPPNSMCAEVLQLCSNDGYMALKQLIFNSHPVFEDQPATLITEYPRQQAYSLLKYHSLFRDFLQLRAFISNQKASLDDPHELDIFITNATHGTFLNKVTREERKTPSLAHKYKGNQILETLAMFLKAPDSPAVHVPALRAPPAPQRAPPAPQRAPKSLPLPPLMTQHLYQSFCVAHCTAGSIHTCCRFTEKHLPPLLLRCFGCYILSSWLDHDRAYIL